MKGHAQTALLPFATCVCAHLLLMACGRIGYDRDTDRPILRDDAFVAGDGSGLVRTNPIRLALGGQDASSKITMLCLDWTSAEQPALDHPCWDPIGGQVVGGVPGRSVSLEGVPFLLGFTPGRYTIRAWLRDSASNISLMTNDGAGTLGKDLVEIESDPAEPPEVEVTLVASTAVPSDPLSAADRDLSNGPVYIKWRANDFGVGWADGPIDITYSTTDRDYQVIARGLTNGDSGCPADSGSTTADDGATGCYAVTSGVPTAESFHIRVSATNSLGMVGSGSSLPLNLGRLRALGGVPDVGFEGSANALLLRPVESTNVFLDTHILAVSRAGHIYFRDALAGVLVIDATDSVARFLLPTTGTSEGDSGPVSEATAADPSRILLDHEDRLLVYDEGRIRRIDTHADPMTIETLVGGGSDTGDEVDALRAHLPEEISAWVVLPNGDMYFEEERNRTQADGYRVRVYHASDRTLTSLRPRGTGDSLDPNQDIEECTLRDLAVTYDPVSSRVLDMQVTVGHTDDRCPRTDSATYAGVRLNPRNAEVIAPKEPTHAYATDIQAMDGSRWVARRASLVRIDRQSGEVVPVAGTGVEGTCADGTPALECDMRLDDAFIARNGVVYLVDRTRVRVIDEEGRIRTLAGRRLGTGDGGRARHATFHRVQTLGLWSDGTDERLLALDDRWFRELVPGGEIRLIAGGAEGQPEGDLAVEQPLSVAASGQAWDLFSVDATNGDVFFHRDRESLVRLDRASGMWEALIGGGTASYIDPANDGALGSEVDLTPRDGAHYYRPLAFGINDTDILVAQGVWTNDRKLIDTVYNQHAIDDGRKRHVVGLASDPEDFCTDGTPLTSCPVPAHSTHSVTRALFLPGAGRWAVGRQGRQAIWSVVPGGTMATLATLPRNLLAFAYDEITDVVYYCATDGKLYQHELGPDRETELPIPDRMRCIGKTVLLNAARTSLYFPYTYNGLYGIGEYDLSDL